MIEIQGLKHVLLDIEGTTCPVSFVTEVLFPYAQEQIPLFLNKNSENSRIKNIIQAVFAAWDTDESPVARALRKEHPNTNPQTATAYLNYLIINDRKLTPLKELQGLIWDQGYVSGKLKAPLYADVPEAILRWHNCGLLLSVYSSGSVNAQQLLYKYNIYGDLSPLFSHWFDTNVGAKQTSHSYSKIAERLESEPDQILFISDRKSELKAAKDAGLKVLFSMRQDNPETDCGHYISIENYKNLNLIPA